jgi:uncharacterized protein (TIGR02145 family)
MKKILSLIIFILVCSCSTSSDSNGNSNTNNVTGPNVTDVDGNVYQSVTNCNQTWTKQNLNVSKYSDGTPIPQVTSTIQWNSLTTGAWCYYENNTANGTIYGKLYNWYAVAGIYDAASLNNPSLRKKLAPQGWHVPTDSEWTIFIDCLGGDSVAGYKIKSTGTTLWPQPNNGTNESGFTGLPSGILAAGNVIGFDGIGDCAYWWSSTEYNANISWQRHVISGNGGVVRVTSNKKCGFSVRCIKD